MKHLKHGAVLAMLAAGLVACGGAGGSGSQAGGGDDGTVTVSSATLNPPDTYVNLFKWRWTDIGNECTRFIGPAGIGAVQISPPAEHKNVNAWWNIYQPVNHHVLTSDMGNAGQLQTMIEACHAAGVRIYADVVFNQMAVGSGTGVGGSSFDSGTLTYPFFSASDFHPYCDINYSSEDNTTACWLLGMPDLNTGASYVQGQFRAYLNSLIAMGVDGFRIDASKHIKPGELQTILAGMTQTTTLGEPVFITHEVIEDQGWINMAGYQASGTVNEFRFARAIRDALRNDQLSQITTYSGTGAGGGTYQLIPSDKATIFVANHDTERHPTDSLNYTSDSGGRYDLANVYMLGQPYGRAQLQSGFSFSYANVDVNMPSASPYDASGNPIFTTTCSNTSAACGWDFTHRWSTIYPMVKFRSAAAGTAMTVRSTGNGNQIAFSRGSVGFVALNNAGSSWALSTATGLQKGTYCNIVHGLKSADGKSCTADSVVVDASGNISVTVPARGGSALSAVAIYTGQMIDGVVVIPTAPTNLSGSLSGTSATLSWTASAGATSYTVYRATAAAGPFSVAGTSNTTGFSDAGLAAATAYYYYVTASNTAGTSPPSTTLALKPGTPYTSNYPTMHLRGTMNTWGATAMALVANNTWSVDVTLTAGTTYQYKYEVGGGSTWTTNWGLSTASTTSTTSGTLVQGGYNVYFTATATGVHTLSFNDATLAYKVVAPTPNPPAAPTNLTGTVSGSTVALTWTSSAGATSYTVFRGAASAGPFTQLGTTTSTSYNDTGVSPGTYYYAVSASNSAGTSPLTPVIPVVVPSSATTTIRVHYDVGFGNSVAIRGSVSPLTWTKGAAAQWTTGNIWVYTTTDIAAGTRFEYKPLRNDVTWSTGSNYVGTGGATMDIYPSF
ncbi:MAG: alpha-amylase family glycosyl hydrolase [Anaeromyxobacter sp.]